MALGCVACGGASEAGRSASPELLEDVPELRAAYASGGSSAASSGSRAGGSVGSSSLPVGFSGTQQLRGRFGGPVAASDLSPGCRGFIASQPNHQLYNQAELPFLQLVVNADPYDTTLVVGLHVRARCGEEIR